MANQRMLAVLLTGIMVLSVFAVPVAANHEDFNVSSQDATTSADSTAEVSYTVENTGNDSAAILNVTGIPDGWSVDSQDADGGDWNEDDTSWLWQTVSSGDSVNPSLTLAVPEDADTGTYDVTAELRISEGHTETVTPTVTVEDEPDNGGDGDTGVTGDADLSSGSTYWQGQNLVVDVTGEAEAGDTIQVRRVNDDNEVGGLQTEETVDEDGTVTVDTDDLDGFYVLVETDDNVVYEMSGGSVSDTHPRSSSGDPIVNSQFEVAVQSFSTELDEDDLNNDGGVDLGDEATIELDSNRGSYALNVSSEDLDDGDLNEIFGEDPDANGELVTFPDEEIVQVPASAVADGEVEANFSVFDDSGSYTFDFEVADTTASASTDLEVTERDVDLEFANNVVTEEVGDTALITIQLEDTDGGELFVGGEDVNYMERVSFSDENDDGQVTISMNTWNAGQNGDSESVFGPPSDNPGSAYYAGIIASETDDEVTDVQRYSSDDFGDGSEVDIAESLSSQLEQADYDLVVAPTDTDPELNDDDEITIPDESDVATLDLVDRSTDGVSTHVAPDDHDVAGLVDAFDDSELQELLNDTTASDNIALGDLLVIEVEASGVHANMIPGVSAGAHALNGEVGVYLNVSETNVGGNRETAQVNWTEAGDNAIIYDDSPADVTRLVVDTGEIDEFESGEDYEVEFKVGNEELDDSPSPYVDDGEEESVTTEFSLADRDAEFDNVVDDELQVAQNEEATITGTTNVAPNSELDVRLRRTGENPFLETQTIEVNDDGSFNATFDTSDIAVDTAFTATVRKGGNTLSDEVDGVIVEGEPETPTETETPPDTETDTPPDTETETETEDMTDETPTDTPTDSDGQPGFGIAIAIVALLGAGLLALRRQH